MFIFLEIISTESRVNDYYRCGDLHGISKGLANLLSSICRYRKVVVWSKMGYLALCRITTFIDL